MGNLYSLQNQIQIVARKKLHLKKINDNGNILLQTPDFRTIFNEEFSPGKIIDNNGFVYLYDAQKGWLVFDYYGAFKQNIPQANLNNIQVLKNELYGFDSAQNLHRYSMQTFKESIYHFNKKLSNPIKMQLYMNSLYVLQNDGLYISSIIY